MKSSNLALRLDGAEFADAAPDAKPCDAAPDVQPRNAAPHVDAKARRRARFDRRSFDHRAFDERVFEQRSIVVGAQGFRAFRVS